MKKIWLLKRGKEKVDLNFWVETREELLQEEEKEKTFPAEEILEIEVEDGIWRLLNRAAAVLNVYHQQELNRLPDAESRFLKEILDTDILDSTLLSTVIPEIMIKSICQE